VHAEAVSLDDGGSANQCDPERSRSRVLLGRVPDMAAGIDAQQSVSDRHVVIRSRLLVAKERVRQPQRPPLAFLHLYLVYLLGGIFR